MLLQKVRELVKEMIGNSVLPFDNPVEARITTLFTYRIYAITVSPDDKVHVMNSENEFSILEESDDDTISEKIIKALYDRVRLIESNFIIKNYEDGNNRNIN